MSSKYAPYKLSNADIQEILHLLALDVKKRTIAAKFKVHRATIWTIEKRYEQTISKVSVRDRNAAERAGQAAK